MLPAVPHLPHPRYIWASTADGSFTISEDTENEPLGRGTLIKIHLKEEAQVGSRRRSDRLSRRPCFRLST